MRAFRITCVSHNMGWRRVSAHGFRRNWVASTFTLSLIVARFPSIMPRIVAAVLLLMVRLRLLLGGRRRSETRLGRGPT